MSDFPWPEPLWRPSAESQTATVDGAPYAVTLEIAPPEALDLAWQQLAGELTGTGSALSDGGAALVRLGTGGVSVVSVGRMRSIR